MSKWLKRWVLGMAVSAGVAGLGLSHGGTARAHAAETAGQQVASVDELKAEAIKALRLGKFDLTNDLLGKAAGIGNDPTLTHWADWSSQFEVQLKAFQAERHKEFSKFVDYVKKLNAAGKDAYVIEFARDAYIRSDDKEAFLKESWVTDIIKKSTALADECESKEQWLKCLRLYSALLTLEPSKPVWKDKLKLATRHIRLIATYAPDQLKAIQESEGKDREEVDALIHPSTQPATKPTAKPVIDEANDNFKVDWREMVHGIKMDMLSKALIEARENYYREVALRDMLGGGVAAIKALVTTAGLEKTFPNLAAGDKREAFLARLDELAGKVKNATGNDEATEIHRALLDLTHANADTVNLPEEVIVSEFADGSFAELDPFSSMIWPNDLEEFNKATQGEFSGVGIQIQSDEDGGLKVVSPLEDSPAYRAGIKAGDVITAINGKNAKGISITQAVKNITGKAKTNVTLTVRSPDHTSKDIPLVRETIKVASIKGWSHKPGGGWEYIIDPDQRIAYIRLTNFTRTTGEELNKAMDDLQALHARGMILDLRGNPGGLLTAAIDVCEKYVGKGKVIVSTRADRETPNPPTAAKASGGAGTNNEMPLIVLVNQYSASASEIVSGCLKDNHRALIVGERTFGKGSVQMLFPLRDREAFLKLTTSHYYLPLGKCIHREENSTDWGVNPDVTVEVTPEQMGEAIKARQDLDVLHAIDEQKLAEDPKAAPTTAPVVKKDPLTVDAQLSAALLLLRLELNGAQI